MNKKEEFKANFKKRIYRFVLQFIKFINSLPGDRVCRTIGDQLIRSGTSIGGNYFEAQAASSKKDFINYFHHSLKSANESKFWLCVLRDTQRINAQELNNLLTELTEISNIFATSLLTLKGRR